MQNALYFNMKVIISHDIDHISVSEHFTDFIIPKFLVRMQIELLLGKISAKEYFLRYKNLLSNKWNNIQELMDYNEKQNIPATFFMGVNQGVGLNYGLELAEKWTKKIVSRGFACGVHGIAYLKSEDIEKEYTTFKEISGLGDFGIRMHYLRSDKSTLEKLASAGYLFDSTDYRIASPYKVGEMVEFPLHIMEGYMLEGGKKYQNNTLEKAVQLTIERVKKVQAQGQELVTILFHDRYFDNSFLAWKKWYIQVVEYCKAEGFEFTDYASNLINHRHL